VSDLRQQILSTAKILFIQQGYHGLSMRQIAEALGVSKAALYYYFRDKEELLIFTLPIQVICYRLQRSLSAWPRYFWMA
jgi:DNA-binding transcriptional regulator YbjK